MNELNRVAAREVIYEVESVIDAAVLADFDAWLPGHVSEVIACRGFIGAEIQTPPVAAGEPPRRRVQYRLDGAASLDAYLENDAPRLRADGVARFGDRVRFERRMFEKQRDLVPESRLPPHCSDCGAPVTASFCGACGQAGGIHVMSLGEVFEDATHSLLHVDSRVWRTLRALVLKPGQLTNEFIAGRRQRYLPPFRLYLVISLLFFGLRALLPDGDALGVTSPGAGLTAPATSTAGEADAGGDREQAAQELAAAAADPDTPPAVAELARVAAGSVETGGAAAPGSCRINVDLPGLRWLKPLLERACEKVRADGGRRLGEVFLHNAPRLMFIFLPLIAAAALLFYWRPRRLYAEHLVFFLHTHAFLFLALSVQQLSDALERAAPLLETPLGIAMAVLVLYVVYYPYRAMRVVYRNGRLLTLVKFTLLSVAYFTLLGVTMAAGIVYSMLSL